MAHCKSVGLALSYSCFRVGSGLPAGASDLVGAVVVSVVFVGQVGEAVISGWIGQPTEEELGHRDMGDEAVFELPAPHCDRPVTAAIQGKSRATTDHETRKPLTHVSAGRGLFDQVVTGLGFEPG